MDQRNSRGSGFFLVVAIILGLAVGVAIHSPIIGVIGGTVLGSLIAIGFWMADRRRNRD